jgi:lambda repressor-like predicted transcriptional regulator
MTTEPMHHANDAAYRRWRYRHDPAYRARRKAERPHRTKIETAARRADIAFRADWCARFLGRLREAGWSYRRIAERAGLSACTVWRAAGQHAKPEPKTFRALWSLSLDLAWEQGREGEG